MNDKPMKYKDLEVKCECGRKIKVAYPIPALSEYHDDMYISQEMEYQERKQLQSNWNSLREFVTLKEKPKVFGAKNGKTLELAMEFVFDMVLDKMNELEGEEDE